MIRNAFRPLADNRYHPALDNMGLTHAQDYDCGRTECSRCQPYRELERAYWDSLTDEEKHNVHFGRFGL